MDTDIVLIPVEGNINARHNCEDIENTTYVLDKVTDNNIFKEVEKDLSEDEPKGIEVWNISDFMDLVNDEEFYPNNYFMSYVYGKQK